ncbi:FtsZ/tubulin family protein [Vibrio cholerae]|uniref:hypothetical protein n=1 Tax=Vibrio cholerae TaxID=666 RepID=UPI0013B47490|nr:hypothetical protein [Vibrio cholerae]
MEKLIDSKTVPAIHSEFNALLSKHTPTSTAILGLGGIGCKVITLALESIPSPKCTMLAVNTDSRQLDKLSARHTLLLSSESDERFTPIISTHDLIVVISGAGGIGERVTRKIINHCHLAGKTLVPVLFKPFEFEGIKRNVSFQNLVQEALALNNKVLTIDNQEAYEQGSSDKSFLTIETELNELCMNLIRQLEEL